MDIDILYIDRWTDRHIGIYSYLQTPEKRPPAALRGAPFVIP
jgi:hypothetical protein